MHNYSTDNPISTKEQDRFQRYDFAKRIADTIINRNSEEGIIIGVYGKWGDGKTSVLNIIENELKSKECIPIRFNPWRYKGEEELLKQFFEVVARELKQELLTGKEKKGNWLKKYASFGKSIKLPFVDISELLNNIGSALNSLGIEKLKERINTILNQQKKKVVIFIDDIDRLDKEEIHAVFRLVKLNADFKKTTYILSFDEAMVASAIGDRFGKGNNEAGRDFLEKIIQVRLTLPKAQPSALKEFQFDLINKIIDNSGYGINENNASKFIREFYTLLLRLETPRQAAQYANSISFSIPLLYGEVNLSDLLLIEGIKIFYPKHYEFIKSNPEYFIGNYTYDNGMKSKDEKKKMIMEQFDILGQDLQNHREREAIKELLCELFPQLNGVFSNYSYGNESYTNWYKNKQIASAYYFERFFSYCVIKGQLSDISFNELRNQLSNENVDGVGDLIRDLIQKSNDQSFIEKVKVHQEEYNWIEGCNLIRGICINGSLLSGHDDKTFMLTFQSTQRQAAYIIHKFFERKKQEIETDKLLNFAKEVIQKAQPSEFQFQILTEVATNVISRMVFSFEEIKELHSFYRKLIFKKIGNEPLFKVLPHQFYTISEYWGELDNISLKSYVRQKLEEDLDNVMFLLKSFTRFIRSNTNPNGYYTDLSKEYFRELNRHFDLQLIKQKLFELYTEEKIKEEEVIWTDRDETQTNINIARQFLYWCDQPLG